MENTNTIELTGLEAIRKDIADLRGTTVRVFGQPQVVEPEVDELTIDILDIIEKLESYEVDTVEVIQSCDNCKGTGEVVEVLDGEDFIVECECCDGMGVVYKDMVASDALELFYENGDLEELGHDNSYNWCAPVSNSFDFQTWRDRNNHKIYVEFKVHRYGDVRCNYTNTAVLEFGYDSEFLEVISECDKFIYVDEYDVNVKVLSNTIEVYDENDNYAFNSGACTIEELKEEIEEYKANQGN